MYKNPELFTIFPFKIAFNASTYCLKRKNILRILNLCKIGIMTEFPCIECTLECNDDTIQCSNCKNWLHRTCTNLSDKDIRCWSDRNLVYLCKCCAFRGTDYDAEGALMRYVHISKISNFYTKHFFS